MKGKYKNRKIQTKWGVFDSQKEFDFWQKLKERESAGVITDLQRQVEYVLIPAQKREIPIKNKFKTERAIKYKADFIYCENGKIHVIDVKGFRTKDYIIKRKLMLYIHGIEVEEV